MSITNLNLTLGNIRSITTMILDILIMWFILFYAIKVVKGNSRTIQIFKGVMLVVILDSIAKIAGLKTLEYFMDIFINWGFLAFIIIFQPEIRALLEKIGKTNMFSRITTLTGSEKENLVDQIVTATMLLSRDETGALISIEQSHSLNDYVATGTRLNSDVTAELLTSIFVTSTPLHDGAVIIQGNKIACASAYFPPTNLEVPNRYGARHRAAIGISEITDAVTIVVSEETGAISITEGGKIFHVNKRQLRNYLLRVICGEETEVQENSYHSEPAREVVISDTKETKVSEETGILNRLMLKKQSPNPSDTGKIEVEEVVTNLASSNVEEDYTEALNKHKPVQEEAPKKTKKGFLRKNKKEVDSMEVIEEEASEIKLPKKKKRPAPSYPEQNRPTTIVEEKVKEEVKEEKPVEKTEFVHDESYQEDTALREDEKIYDTTKLDLSKLVGLNSDLDKTLNMIDELDHDSSTKKSGGDE